MVTLGLSNRASGLYERFSTRAVVARSKKVLGWQLRAAKSREQNFPIEGARFLKFIGQVTRRRVL